MEESAREKGISRPKMARLDNTDLLRIYAISWRQRGVIRENVRNPANPRSLLCYEPEMKTPPCPDPPGSIP